LSPNLPTLTTGTFNLVVKEPNRLPPERRAFSPVQRHTTAPLPVLETDPSYSFRRCLSTHCAHRISTAYAQSGSGPQLELTWGQPPLRLRSGEALGCPVECSSTGWRATERVPRPKSHALSAQADAEDSSLDKRPCGGSCEKRLNPSRNSVPE
jgi:hypothetical protein